MKTVDEKIQQCKVCKNRDFDPMCGIVCSLTKEKPSFENVCDDFVGIEQQASSSAFVDTKPAKGSGLKFWAISFIVSGLFGILRSEFTKNSYVFDWDSLALRMQVWTIFSLVIVALYSVIMHFIKKPSERVEDGSISGWLAFFIWIYVGVGSLYSLILNIVQPLSQGLYGPYFYTYIASCLILFAVGVLTIIAFYKRKTNAVSLAYAFIAMRALEGVSTLVIAIISNDTSMYPQAGGLLIWAIIWGIYLHLSTKVKCRIPLPERTSGIIGKIFIAIYAICLTIYTGAIVYTQTADNPRNILLSNSSYIAQCVAESNKELPMELGNGMTIQRMSIEENSIVYVYQYTNEYLSESDLDYLSDEAVVSRHESLYNMSKSSEGNEFFYTCFECGYNVVYRYIDAVAKTLYTVTMTPEDYKAIKAGEIYKCPNSELEDMLRKYNVKQPTEYGGGLTLCDIYLTSDKKTLVYKVRLPQMTADMYSTVTPAYLNDYFFRNLPDLSDFIMRLAVVNQMTICFDISTASGVKYTKVNITPDKYNKIK